MMVEELNELGLNRVVFPLKVAHIMMSQKSLCNIGSGQGIIYQDCFHATLSCNPEEAKDPVAVFDALC